MIHDTQFNSHFSGLNYSYLNGFITVPDELFGYVAVKLNNAENNVASFHVVYFFFSLWEHFWLLTVHAPKRSRELFFD